MAADEVHDELEALEAIFLEGGFEVDESRAEPGCLPTLRIRLRTTDGDGACSPWLWLEVDRPEDYPELPAKVRVVADSKVRWIPNCHLAALADVGKQVAHAQAGEVSVYAVYDAVSEAVLDVLGDIDGPGGDAGGCSPPLNPAPKNELAEKAAVDSKSGEAAAAAPTPAPQGQSSDMLGVSLRFILNFAARHRVGGFGKWEAPCEEHTTGSVCIRVVKPATKSQHVAFTSLGPPHIAEGETSPPTHFVSHSWGCPFASLATSLLVHQLGHDVAWAMLEDVVDLHKLSSRLEHELSRGEVPEYFYWIDVFAKNQHVVESDATAAELASMVNAVSIGAVMVIHPLREPRMLSRVWCLFEMHQAMVLGRELSGVPSFDGMLELHSVMEKERKAREVSPGKSRDGEVRRTSSGPDRRSMKATRKKSIESKKAGELGFSGALGHTLNACWSLCSDAISGIDVRSAQATVAKDREMILSEIESSVGADAMTKTSRDVAKMCIFECVAAALESRAELRNSDQWRQAAKVLRDDLKDTERTPS